MYAVFARQSGGGTVPEFSGERMLNMRAEPFPDASTGRMLSLPSQGLTPWVSGFGGAVRALYTQNGMTYAAAGGQLWEAGPAGAVTNLGAIGDSPYTTITGNGFDVAAAVNDRYWVWDGSTLSQPSTGAFSNVGSVTGAAGYVILGEKGGQRFSITSLNDAKTIDGLDFASAESRPDPLVTAISDHKELWLFGTRTVEVWYNSGDPLFPWAPLSGSSYETGLAWRNAVTTADSGVWFVGNDRVVYRASAGAGLQRVSTSRVDEVLADVAGSSDVRMFSFSERGRKMVCVRLPAAPAWVFDLTTGLWSERNTGAAEDDWIATSAIIRDDGTQIVGGTDGAIHILGGLTDGGKLIRRELVSLPIVRDGAYFTVSQVKLQFAQGRTNFSGTPAAMIEVSRDGRTWDQERQIPMGGIGDYGFQTWVNGLGRARSFKMRLRITDAIDAPLLGVSVKAA